MTSEQVSGASLGLKLADAVSTATVKRRYSSRQLKAFVMTIDLLSILAGMLLSYGLSRLYRPQELHSMPLALMFGACCLPLWAVVFSGYGLYKTRRVAARVDEFRNLVHATLASVIVMAAVGFLLKLTVSRLWLVICVPAVVACCLCGREVVRHVFSRLRRTGRLVRPVVIVGSNGEAMSLCEALADPVLGYQVVGVVDDIGVGHVGSMRVLGTTDQIVAVVQAAKATNVLVAMTSVSDQASNRLVRELIEAGIHVELSSSLRGISAGRLRVRPLGQTPLIYVEPAHRGGWRAAAKRTFDVVVATTTLAVASPVFLVVAVAVKLSSRGRVFFIQERIGKNAAPFRLYKFRTMVTGAEDLLPALKADVDSGAVLFKARDDPRVTRLGRILRRFSIDELPQLLNVVRGDMSLVGPRPALFSEMSSWTPELKGRLRVRPGMTGMWQVSGRSDLTFADYVRNDLYYVENWSLLIDLAILAKTLPVVLAKRGAY
ncbi:MAG: sugar transferase [Acidimicrobiales bacterium]